MRRARIPPQASDHRLRLEAAVVALEMIVALVALETFRGVHAPATGTELSESSGLPLSGSSRLPLAEPPRSPDGASQARPLRTYKLGQRLGQDGAACPRRGNGARL